MKLAEYIIIWTDSVPVAKGLMEAAQAQEGEHLAAGGLHDVSE